MKNLDGKVALVTGASRGIGRAIAMRLANDGALVAIHYGRNKIAADETISEIESNGGKAFLIEADLNLMDGVKKIVEQLKNELQIRVGTSEIDILVNNAGIGTQGTIENTTEEVFDEIMAVNIKAPFFLIQQTLPLLRVEGRVINISSAEVRLGFTGSIAYGLSKGALNTMTLPLAKHLGERGITVNTIMPGYTKTDINAKLLDDSEIRNFATDSSVFGRIGQVEDIADVVAFLASSDSRWVTGQIIDVSGGFCL
ncbi:MULTISPECIES: SDR family oxidoreductase [Bacillus]|nr:MULTISPECIES: SDR family oxidoreductase [Bacillus]BCA32252.1 short-chain dehydrogenase [Bacillus wiedmannii]EKS7865463.1 SDR family oxidoreductase [Bacillus cereus]EOO29754.1 short chain dehydrogenase [Bacillus cereus VD133]KMP34573.1 short-chain dehydrogenase [Bacillus cereus]MBL3890704.1 SDR family oxidoreductase [Bacillus cereus]